MKDLIGKSYQVKHKKGIEKYLKTGKRFVLMRRFEEEIKTYNVLKYFEDVNFLKLTNGKYNTIDVYRKTIYLANEDLETHKITRGEKIGYVVALSTEQNRAGGSYLDVEDIIFEEFMSRSTYLHNEVNKLMNLYATIDRKRLTTKLWLVGNSISRVCPYIYEWGLHKLITTQKQGTILVKEIEDEEHDDNIRIAIEYCKSTGKTSGTIGRNAKMINTGAWETSPQPHLPKSYKEYKKLYVFAFKYNDFKFLSEYLTDGIDTFWFIYPYNKELKDDIIVISNEIRTSIYWQRDIYNISINNNNLKNLFNTFKENKIFFCNDMCGTDFKQVIDFIIRR